MAINCKLRVAVVAGGVNCDLEQSLSFGGFVAIEETIAGESTDVLVNCAIDVSQTKLLVLYSDVDVTIKTNSDSVPDDTLVLAAGVPLVWQPDNTVGGVAVSVLTADVTQLYVTNAAAASANLRIYVLSDPTP